MRGPQQYHHNINHLVPHGGQRSVAIIAGASEADASLSIIGYDTTSGRTKRFDDWIGFPFEVN